MLVSYQWLKQWVNLDVNPERLGENLTSAGLEVSSIEQLLQLDARIIVGEIVDYWIHPLKSSLTICMVNVGRKKPISIISGAKNIQKGMKVAVALPGAVISNGNRIRKHTIYETI